MKLTTRLQILLMLTLLGVMVPFTILESIVIYRTLQGISLEEHKHTFQVIARDVANAQRNHDIKDIEDTIENLFYSSDIKRIEITDADGKFLAGLQEGSGANEFTKLNPLEFVSEQYPLLKDDYTVFTQELSPFIYKSTVNLNISEKSVGGVFLGRMTATYDLHYIKNKVVTRILIRACPHLNL